MSKKKGNPQLAPGEQAMLEQVQKKEKKYKPRPELGMMTPVFVTTVILAVCIIVLMVALFHPIW